MVVGQSSFDFNLGRDLRGIKPKGRDAVPINGDAVPDSLLVPFDTREEDLEGCLFRDGLNMVPLGARLRRALGFLEWNDFERHTEDLGDLLG